MTSSSALSPDINERASSDVRDLVPLVSLETYCFRDLMYPGFGSILMSESVNARPVLPAIRMAADSSDLAPLMIVVLCSLTNSSGELIDEFLKDLSVSAVYNFEPVPTRII